jgi:DNA-binding NtrC family response regulator
MMVVAVGITSEEVRSLAGQAPATRAGRLPGLLKCLVVSGDEGLRRRLDTMAELGGWSACETPVDAAELRSIVEGDFQLVIADIARPLGERVNDTVEIAEEFASRPSTLVVVCGVGDSIDEELWARQLGAWVYLPGVSGGDALMSLFSEARRVVERRGVFQFV